MIELGRSSGKLALIGDNRGYNARKSASPDGEEIQIVRSSPPIEMNLTRRVSLSVIMKDVICKGAIMREVKCFVESTGRNW